MDEKGKITKAAGAMSLATLISRILGYARDVVLAFFYGATGLSDTFFVAFRIPNLLRELFAEGSMSAAVIPVLSEYERRDGHGEARRLVQKTFTFIVLAVGLVTALGILFAPAVVSVIAPGFVKDPEKFSTTVRLTKIMFPFLLFISLSALTMGALNVKRVFFVPSFAPAMLNITVISSVFILYGSFQSPITAVAIGTVLGGFVQLAFQWPSFFRHGYSIRPDFSFGHPGLRKIALLVLPVTLGMAVAQINIIVSNILASFLPSGSITYLFYSLHLVQFPIGVFGVAMGMAALPSLTGHALRGDTERLREDFSHALRVLFFISVPAMAGLIALREPIVSTLFQRGRFDYAATVGTSEALLFYSFGIWAIVGVRVLAVTSYSMQDTRTPVKSAVVALLTNVVLSLALMWPMKHGGLALANAISSMVNFALLFHLMRRRLGRLEGRRIARSFIKVSAASAVMGVAGWLMLSGGPWSMPGMLLKKAVMLFGSIFVSMLIYALMAFLLKSEEFSFMLNLIRDRTRRKVRDT